VRAFLAGPGYLARGVGWTLRHPRALLLGMIPALLVGLVYAAAVVALVVNADEISIAATGFAESWATLARDAVRLAAGIALVLAGLALAVITFTAVVLAVGAPFYDRITDAVLAEAGGEHESHTVLDIVGDVIVSLLWAALVALATLAAGFIPLVGAPLAAVFGVGLGGLLLGRELTSPPLQALTPTPAARSAVTRSVRRTPTGFGVVCHLAFLVPGLAVVLMPGAVAGAALLSLDAVRASSAARTLPPPRPA
jgi:CysZ protein